ncbi:MAG: uroporphyrinogen decarboxylase family protein [Armatimonadetes bacterium]|nr:uroporphyrinogen decarboxylase family protein [Armatimonadota bacterium]
MDNSKTRLLRAMNHEPVDRVPVMCQLAIGHYLLNTDASPSELWFTSEGFADALVALQQRYRFDGILINLPGRDPDWRKDIDRIEKDERGDETVYWKNGDRSWCPHDDNVHHFPRESHHRPGLEDVDPQRLYYDDPHCVGGLKYPFYYGLHPHTANREEYFPDYLFRATKLVCEKAGPEVAIHGEIFSPFTQMMELFGYEDGLVALITHPHRSLDILAAYAQGCIDYATRLIEHGADAILMSSAFAGGGFVSPRQYEEFVVPCEFEVVSTIKEKGVKVYTHTCGDIGDRLESMALTGLDGIDTLDPPPLGSVDLEDAKRRIGDRVFFKGNMDPVNTLLKGSSETVKKDALWRLKVGSVGSGYILSSACSVAPRTPPENLMVLAEASEEFGEAS